MVAGEHGWQGKVGRRGGGSLGGEDLGRMGSRGDGSSGGWVKGWMAGMTVAGEGELTGIQEAGSPAIKTPMGRVLFESRLWEGKSRSQANNKSSSHR